MKMQTPLSLSDRQLRFVRAAASAVPIAQRDAFLQSVARHLVGEPSDDAVQAAINATLDRTPVFLCDAQPKEKAT
jgi:hypothetical protein